MGTVLYGGSPPGDWDPRVDEIFRPRPGDFRFTPNATESVCQLCGLMFPPVYARTICDGCRAKWASVAAASAPDVHRSEVAADQEHRDREDTSESDSGTRMAIDVVSEAAGALVEGLVRRGLSRAFGWIGRVEHALKFASVGLVNESGETR